MQRILTLLLLIGSVAHAQTTPSRTEPGEAEARVRSTTAPLITQFTSPPTEYRGVWLASRDMFGSDEELLSHLDLIKSANFNSVLIDTYFRGFVAYPDSAVIPQYPQLRGRDVIQLLVEGAHRRGMDAELWMEFGFYAYFTPDAKKDPSMGAILDAHPELLSIDAKGTRFIHRSFGDFHSICPSNPKSHQILAGVYAEAARRYDVQGVNLDRIRYADGDYCYCDYCKAHFKQDTGLELTEFKDDPAGAEKWLQWKRQQTVSAVRTIATAIRAARPGIRVTSYVVGPDEMNSKAQGWDLWMQQKLLDAVQVSMYGADIRDAATKALKLLDNDHARLIAAISCDQDTPVFLSNIEFTRQLGLRGQATWHFGDLRDDAASLRAGPYRAPAEVKLVP